MLFNFWKRRWFRTLPNYYLFLLINYLIFTVYIGEGERNVLRYVFFLQNLAWPGPDFFGESWSLALEEWFYISFPLLLFGFSKIFNGKKGFFKSFMASSLILFIVPVFAREMGQSLNLDELKSVLLRIDSIIYGVVLAYLSSYNNKIYVKIQAIWPIGACLFLGILACHFYGIIEGALFRLIIFLTPISIFLMFPFLSNVRIRQGYLEQFITQTSLISYSLYLVHLPLYRLFWKSFGDSFQGAVEVFIFRVGCIVICYGLSYLIYKYFEVPMTNLRDKFSTH